MLCAYEGKISIHFLLEGCMGESPVLAIGLCLIDSPVLEYSLHHDLAVLFYDMHVCLCDMFYSAVSSIIALHKTPWVYTGPISLFISPMHFPGYSCAHISIVCLPSRDLTLWSQRAQDG